MATPLVNAGILGSQVMAGNPLSLQTTAGARQVAGKGVDTAIDGAVSALSLKDELLLRHAKTKKNQALQELLLKPLEKLTEVFVETFGFDAKIIS